MKSKPGFTQTLLVRLSINVKLTYIHSGLGGPYWWAREDETGISFNGPSWEEAIVGLLGKRAILRRFVSQTPGQAMKERLHHG